MSAFLAPMFGAGYQAFNNTGGVLSGGLLYTYVAGTTTPQATWTDSTQSVLNANPIVLNSAGRATSEVWLQGGQACKFVLKDSAGNQLGAWDYVAGINDANYNAFSEWVPFGTAPTYVSGTSFTVSGNQVSLLQVGRRIQFYLLGGTYYATVATSTYNSGPGNTTITLTNDTANLDSTLYAFSYGFMSAVNSSMPIGVWAPLSSPVFINIPRAPTASPGNNSTQLATTAYVDGALGSYAPLASPVFTGNPTAPTPSPGDADTSIATTAFVAASFAPLASPVFTGNPTAPTPSPGDADTSIATTAFVAASFAPLASPQLTGTPTAPTATAGTSTTQLATTAFVQTTAFSSALPNQAGNAGKFVTTNGSTASWVTVNVTPFSDNTALSQVQAVSLYF